MSTSFSHLFASLAKMDPRESADWSRKKKDFAGSRSRYFYHTWSPLTLPRTLFGSVRAWWTSTVQSTSCQARVQGLSSLLPLQSPSTVLCSAATTRGPR